MSYTGKYLLFFLLALLFWTCTSNDELAIKDDSTYFPLHVGSYFIYDIEETTYSVINGQEDLFYQLKMALVDSFQNNTGGITYVMHRSTRNNPATIFEYLDTWSARIESTQLVVNEGNLAFIKLVFPIGIGRTWNGNALNNLEGDDPCGDNGTILCDLYKIEAIGVPFEFNGESLVETIEVVQNNNMDVIVKQDVRKEIYARNIGLVYKESSILNYCTVGSCIGQQQIDDGYKLKQTLVEYGKD